MGKLKKLLKNPVIYLRDYLNNIRPVILNEINVDISKQNTYINLEKDVLYLSEKLDVDSEPVDVVFTWVDDSDPVWRDKLNKYKKEINPSEMSGSMSRFSNSNEIFYSVNSVIKNLPWVRKIYIISDNQKHTKLIDSPKIEFVNHEDFIDKCYLPTFNSHVIEAFFHKIKGISENFIYFNDDVFVAREIEKEHFFKKNGLSSAFFSAKKFDTSLVSPTAIASRNSKALIDNYFGCFINGYFVHTYFPLKKSVYEFAWKEFPNEIEAFLGNKFRGINDLNLATFFVPWISFLTKNSCQSYDVCYYFNHRSAAAEKYWEFLKQKDSLPHSFCANDFNAKNDLGSSEILEKKLKEFFS